MESENETLKSRMDILEKSLESKMGDGPSVSCRVDALDKSLDSMPESGSNVSADSSTEAI